MEHETAPFIFNCNLQGQFFFYRCEVGFILRISLPSFLRGSQGLRKTLLWVWGRVTNRDEPFLKCCSFFSVSLPTSAVCQGADIVPPGIRAFAFSMTYYKDDDDDGVGVHVHAHEHDHNHGDYVNLRWGPQHSQPEATDPSPRPPSRVALWHWVKLVLSFAFLGLLALAVFKWLGPFFIEKVIIPIINWERNIFSTEELTFLVFASVALFPTLLLPSSPSMWIAGMTFGYGFGFLLIISAAAVGISLPFFIGSIFHHKIEVWLEKYPKRASVLRAAGGGNWFHQFRAVALIRLSPFPYIVYNYCAVATNVKYWPYLLGSLVGMVPEILLSIYTGILIRTLANVSHKKASLSAPQIALNAVGFCITVATIILFTVYAKRRLKELEKEDELLLQ